MRARSAVVVAAVAAAVLGVHMTPALGSCALPPGSLRARLQASEIVFVGSVTATDASGTSATVAVESVWRGEVDDNVVVRGGEGAPGVTTSVDRSYREGRRYLFVPWGGDGERFRDNSCTDTRPWRARYAALRPASAVDVTPEASPGATPESPPSSDGAPVDSAGGRPPVLLVVTGAAALLAIAAVVAVAARRRRASPRSSTTSTTHRS